MKCEKCSKCESCEKSTHRTEEEKKSLTKRLNIIEGQIRGIKQMIEDDRYCADILIQLSAISKSLESVENSILESHIKSCVLTEIQSGNTEIIDVGTNEIEFTPQEEGEYIYSCWMNMIKNKIKVIDNKDYFKEEN